MGIFLDAWRFFNGKFRGREGKMRFWKKETILGNFFVGKIHVFGGKIGNYALNGRILGKFREKRTIFD